MDTSYVPPSDEDDWDTRGYQTPLVRGRKKIDRTDILCYGCQDESAEYYRTFQGKPFCRCCYNGARKCETAVTGYPKYIEHFRDQVHVESDKFRQQLRPWTGNDAAESLNVVRKRMREEAEVIVCISNNCLHVWQDC